VLILLSVSFLNKMLDYTFFIDENIPLLADSFAHFINVVRFKGRNLSKEDLIKHKCISLICRSTTLVNNNLLDGTNVRFVGTTTSGIDHVDIRYLKDNNIAFSYAPGSNANSVAEYVLFAILEWKKRHNLELNNKTIGIIGYGNIGKLVALYSYLLGLKVLVNDPPLKDEGYKFPEYVSYKEIVEIFCEANIITNHVPLTNEGNYPTKYLINRTLLNILNNNSLFIHTSRGSVVDEKALVTAIKTKNITTVIDVWEGEPLVNEELMNLSFISTPHIAGYSYDGKLKGALMIATDLNNYFKMGIDLSKIHQELSNNTLFSRSIFGDLNKLYNTLNNKRQILEDGVNFKKIMYLSKDLKRKYLDELRKKYPKRRESIFISI